jgi:hypothetical protein
MISKYLFALALSATFLSASDKKTPVFIELFTSLGCSSCPPADKLLVEMDRQQPVDGARLIVLSEHVDYWNSPKWSDPFSSSAYTERQQTYDSRFGAEAYTPQLVVDGTAVLVGSSWPKAANAIKQSLQAPKIAIQLTAARKEDKAEVNIEVGPNSTDKKAVAFLALAHDRTESHVGGGENAGRDISEVAVAYSIKEIGKIQPGSPFQKSISVSLPSNSKPGDTRLIVFVRRSDTTQVIGAAQTLF